MSTCQVCGAAMIEQVKETQAGTARLAVCSQWAVHPLWYLDPTSRQPSLGAPAAGVPRRSL